MPWTRNEQVIGAAYDRSVQNLECYDCGKASNELALEFGVDVSLRSAMWLTVKDPARRPDMAVAAIGAARQTPDEEQAGLESPESEDEVDAPGR